MEQTPRNAIEENGITDIRRLTACLFLILLPLICGAQELDIYSRQLQAEWKDSVRLALRESYEQKRINMDSGEMRLHWDVFGDKPADGRSLYVSLHGGGGAPAELNDSQWRNQWRLYQPEEGVYVCPRPPFNTWDLHFQPDLDRYYEELIHMMVAFEDVNPDKVYLMGYSAGGDGVWRLAPRLADHWAAASMMAGHPGDVSLENLRNLPFMIWCGAEDAAYDRNVRCRERISEMDSLAAQDPGGYLHEGHIVEGKGHWMDRADTLAIGWMSQFRRNPCPDKIVWRQEEVTHPHFYYLSCPDEEATRGKEVRLHKQGNSFHIQHCDYTRLRIGLTPGQVDFSKAVSVYYNGKRIFHKKVVPSKDVMRRSLAERQDLSFLFVAELEVLIR